MSKPLSFENPLDKAFDVDGTDREVVQYEPVTEGELAEMAAPAGVPAPAEKDEEDKEVDRKIDEVYDHAVTTFQNQMAYADVIEPRFAARNAEVAATYLNIALQAAATRARVKGDRKRAGQFIPGMGGKVTNNTIVATREEIMRMITVDAETKPV